MKNDKVERWLRRSAILGLVVLVIGISLFFILLWLFECSSSGLADFGSYLSGICALISVLVLAVITYILTIENNEIQKQNNEIQHEMKKLQENSLKIQKEVFNFTKKSSMKKHRDKADTIVAMIESIYGQKKKYMENNQPKYEGEASIYNLKCKDFDDVIKSHLHNLELVLEDLIIKDEALISKIKKHRTNLNYSEWTSLKNDINDFFN